jgi:signal transduction histidine kinase
MFSQYGFIFNNLSIILVLLILQKYLLKISFLKAIISIVTLFSLAFIGNIVGLLIIYNFGLGLLLPNGYVGLRAFILGSIINYITMAIILFCIKTFKLFKYIKTEVKMRKFLPVLLNILLSFFFVFVNISFYTYILSDVKNYWVILVECLILCFLMFNFFTNSSNMLKYKSLTIEVDKKNKQLIALNEQLKEHSATVEELAVLKERNRLARDVHDTLGHTLTTLIKMLEVSTITCDEDTLKTKEELSHAASIAREGLREVRRSISGLAPGILKSESLQTALEKLVSDFEKNFEVKVVFSVDDFLKDINPACAETVYRICQESMTNAVRHGNAKRIVIIIRVFDEQFIKCIEKWCGWICSERCAAR